MRIAWFQLIIVGAFVASAYAVTYLIELELLPVYSVFMVVCIVCGWVLTFQSRGYRRSKGLIEHLTFGAIFPVYSNWVKPIPLAWTAQILLISASILAGGIARLLWIVYA